MRQTLVFPFPPVAQHRGVLAPRFKNSRPRARRRVLAAQWRRDGLPGERERETVPERPPTSARARAKIHVFFGHTIEPTFSAFFVVVVRISSTGLFRAPGGRPRERCTCFSSILPPPPSVSRGPSALLRDPSRGAW